MQVSNLLILFAAASQVPYSQHRCHGDSWEDSVVTIPLYCFRSDSLFIFRSALVTDERELSERLVNWEEGSFRHCRPSTSIRSKDRIVIYSKSYLYGARLSKTSQFRLRCKCCPRPDFNLNRISDIVSYLLLCLNKSILYFGFNFSLQFPFNLKLETSSFRQKFPLYLSVKTEIRIDFNLVLIRILVNFLKYLYICPQMADSTKSPDKPGPP